MRPRTLVPFAGAALLLGTLVAASGPARESHDLRPKFQEGQKLVVSNQITMVLGLDDLEADFAGQPMPADVTMDMEIELEQILNEEVLGAADGALSKLRRHHESMSVDVTGEAGAMGQMESIDQSQDIPLQGRTLLLERGEDGAVKVTDETEGEAIDEAMVKTQTLESHFELFLPKEPVAVGDSWDVGKTMIEEFARQASAQAEGDADMARVIGVVRDVMESSDVEAVGRLVSVEGNLARLEWTMKLEVKVDDLFQIVRDMADPEDVEDIPEDAQGSIEMAMEIKGTGAFDMTLHQLTSLELAGEYSLSADAEMTQGEGMEMSGSAAISGTVEMSGGVAIAE